MISEVILVIIIAKTFRWYSKVHRKWLLKLVANMILDLRSQKVIGFPKNLVLNFSFFQFKRSILLNIKLRLKWYKLIVKFWKFISMFFIHDQPRDPILIVNQLRYWVSQVRISSLNIIKCLSIWCLLRLIPRFIFIICDIWSF